MRWIPRALSVILLWSLTAYLIVFVDPELIADIGIKGAYLPLILSFFLALLYTFSLVFGAIKLALVVAFVLAGLLLLNIFRFLTVLTLALSLGVLVYAVYRFYSSKYKVRVV